MRLLWTGNTGKSVYLLGNSLKSWNSQGILYSFNVLYNGLTLQSIFVPTIDTTRIQYLMDLLVRTKKSVLLGMID